MRSRALAFVAILSLPLLGIACAEAGADGLDDDDDDVLPTLDAGDASVTGRPDSGPASPPRGSSSSSSGGSDAGGSGSSSGGSSSGGSSSGGSSSSGGEPDVCTGATCAGATPLGEINGDSGSPTVTTNGNESQWVLVHVHDSGGGGVNISYTLHFVPAAGVDYELRVVDAIGATCTSTTKVVPPAQYNTYESHWTDDQFAVDDGHDVYVQVKQIGGTCPSATDWTLGIEGNTY